MTPEALREAAENCRSLLMKGYRNVTMKQAQSVEFAARLCDTAAEGPRAWLCTKKGQCHWYDAGAVWVHPPFPEDEQMRHKEECGGTLIPLYALEVDK